MWQTVATIRAQHLLLHTSDLWNLHLLMGYSDALVEWLRCWVNEIGFTDMGVLLLVHEVVGPATVK